MGISWLLVLGLVVGGGLPAGAASLDSARDAVLSEVERTAEEAPPSEEARRFAESVTPVKGSEADEGLQVQVAARLFEMEHASRPTCTPRLLQTTLVEPEEGGAWTERWFVKGCQRILPYRVTFEPDETGAGTAFTAMADIGRHGVPSR